MKSKGIRRAFRWIAATVVLAVAAIVALLILGREPVRTLPKPEACPVVSNVIDAIVAAFAPSADDVEILDVRKLSVAAFAAEMDRWSPEATLWTPGDGDWIVIGARKGPTNRLDRVMDEFAAVATPYSLPEIFANYVGTIAGVKPAIEHLNPGDGVVPELFVTREVPAWGWLDVTGVETDILAKVASEMRSMQVVRRVVLEGNAISRGQNALSVRQREDASIAKWRSAFLRSPNDTLLLERMHHLRKNAEVFYKVGKFGMASKCYETLLRIKPDDAVAAANLAECLKRLGKRELSEAVLKKAESLRSAAGDSAR